MIDVIHDNLEEMGTESPDATRRVWEELLAPQFDPLDSQSLPGTESHPWEAEPSLFPGSPLEWYLIKLLQPTEDAPREQVPQRADQWQSDETPAAPPLEATNRHGLSGLTETPRESKPLWQTVGEESTEAPASSPASTSARQSPAVAETAPAPQERESPKSRRKSSIRSHAPREKTNGSRRKLMVALIPILAIALVLILKHPLGARSTVQAAGVRPSETARPVIPGVEIAWQIPSPYEPGGRDPMQLPPPPVMPENPPTDAHPTETPVELTVMGILHSEDRPAAIVDTQVVHEGQQVSGTTVVKIDKDGVEFERNGRKWKQTVNK